MDLFTYLMAKKGHNTHRDLFSYLLGKNAGGSGTYTAFSGTSLNISNTLQAKIKNIALEGNTSQDGTPTPDTPIPIKVVTGGQNISIRTKNLYDESKITDVSTYRSTATINNDKSITITSTGTNGYAIIRPFFNFKANETYTVSFNVDNVNNFDHMYLFINASTTGGGYSKNPYVTITKTTDSLLGIGIYPNANATVTISNIQIEKGTTATEYVPYQSQTYPLSLGNIELAKIGNYKDYIFKNVTGSPYYNADLDLNGWYLHKEIDKVILNGSENWVSETAYTGYYRFNASDILPPFTRGNNGLNNRFIQRVNQQHGDYQYLYLQSNNGNIHIQILQSLLTNGNASTFKNWLSNNNTMVYYVLAIPTNTKITDTTLIPQLENINNARSYKDTTIIECTSESTDNEAIGFSGDIKVTSVGLGNSLNTSLLSSNIQEETNIDDIQEEPNLDEIEEQNDEPIENEEIEEPIEEEVS